MNRKEFLQKMGFSAGAIAATYCLGLTGCMQQQGIKPSGSVDFTIDISQSQYSALKNVGGYIRTNDVVIAHTEQDVYVAVTQICSHQGQPQVMYRSGSNDFFCTVHGATYNVNGKGTNSFGRNGLTTYQVDVSGTQLHVH